MKRILSVLLLMCSFSAFAQNIPQDTPDDFGYVWRNNTNANGPTYDWVDITAVGTEVSGLADDNFVGPVDMGMTFKFYWNTFDKIYIGSNGYIAFSGVNIASQTNGFPTCPTSDNNDGIIAGMLCDLAFGYAGSVARCFTYHDVTNNRFIVTFDKVPFWTNNAQNYDGENTFQFILDADDNSITINYADQQGVWNSGYDGVANPLVVGIENATGAYGLNVSNNVYPDSASSIRVYYPTVPLIDVTDAGPASVQNPKNGGFFAKPGVPIALGTEISNSGNVDIPGQILVNASVKDEANLSVYSGSSVITGLTSNSVQPVFFAPDFTPSAAGSYKFEVTSNVLPSGDMNSANDKKEVELVAIDTTAAGEEIYSYVTYNNPNSGVSWSGGSGNSGGGIYIKPYAYPTIIKAIEILVLPTQGNATYDPPSGAMVYHLDVYADDGPNGSVGQPLANMDIDGATVDMSNATNGLVWNRHDIPDPIIVTQGGVYVGWIQNDDKVVLAAEDTFLISRRTYEILNNAWAPYRDLENTDFYIRIVTEKTTSTAITPGSGINTLSVFPNPSTGAFTVNAAFAQSSDAMIKVSDMTGRKVHFEVLNQVSEINRSLNLSHLTKGVYILEVSNDKGKATEKIIIE
ncbi:MAG: T9SS type A sorting domain-containing protein [Bacteroidia bacterium]|nr:T9SS type A sorting domain-containing protein [Bacteroidia bacterium]